VDLWRLVCVRTHEFILEQQESKGGVYSYSNSKDQLIYNLFRISGDRTSRCRETHGTVPVQSNTETPMVKGQPRGISTRGAEPLLTKSEYRNADLSASRHLYSTESSGPTLPRHFGISRIANPSCTSFCCWKPRMPESRYSGFVPPVPLRSTVPINRGIALRDFDVHGILALANPDSPICDGKWFFLRLRVNLLAPSPRSNDPRDFASLHDNSSRRFSSSMKKSRFTTFVLCDLHWVDSSVNKGTIPSELLSTRTPSELPRTRSCARSSITSKSDEVFWVPVRSRSQQLQPFPFSDFATETQLRPALTCTARIPQPNSGQKRTKVQLLSLLDALYAEVFDCTRCRNLLA
jgi:hypothetical protein